MTLITLLEAIVDRTADMLEWIGASVDRVSKEILERKRRAKYNAAPSKGLEEVLDAIAVDHNVTVKERHREGAREPRQPGSDDRIPGAAPKSGPARRHASISRAWPVTSPR